MVIVRGLVYRGISFGARQYLSQTFVTHIWLVVRVPVLSEQMTDVQPKVSTEGRERTMAFFLAIRRVPKAKQVVMTAGRPIWKITCQIYCWIYSIYKVISHESCLNFSFWFHTAVPWFVSWLLYSHLREWQLQQEPQRSWSNRQHRGSRSHRGRGRWSGQCWLARQPHRWGRWPWRAAHWTHPASAARGSSPAPWQPSGHGFYRSQWRLRWQPQLR